MKLNKNKFAKLTILFAAIITLAFMGCDEGSISVNEQEVQYRRQAQLTNVYKNGIAVLNIQFIAETSSLNQIARLFSESPTVTNLEATQAQWVEVLKVWKNMELYNVGVIEDSFIHFEINRWPSNTETIDNFIASDETINEAFVTGNGSSTKGISAIEYLLFSQETTTETLNTFTSTPNAARQMQYLIALTENLSTKAIELEALWLGYETKFTNLLQNGLSGSQNQLANAMVTLSEQMVIRKLGNALGEANGGVVDITALENNRSKSSLLSLKENLQALSNCYTGNYGQGAITLGFNDYLDLVGAEVLSDVIELSFEECTQKLNAITGSLENEIVVDTTKVLELQEALNELEVLIKVDMSNAIGATVTVNSNDGD
ncbi:imelysin family protein [Patiriisocius marinus]|uniref:imelysin family protein n=1 Tax=Patiriisocius marinus TaxID=1397112 RepID=UPI00232E8477|nr:imelysin family protein [Patiriisocius marinus]